MIAKSMKMLFSRFMRWHFFLGRNPRLAPPFSLILFPLHTSVLCCGIAGILAVKSGPRPLAIDAGADLEQCFSEIRKSPLSRVIAGKIKPDGYLAGVGPLRKMEQDLLLLRQEPHFQVLFFNPAKAAALQSFIPQMTEFLEGEEHLLESEAGRFATAQMEVINSRLILLKDIVWGLEKDILANIGKILTLAGVGHVERAENSVRLAADLDHVDHAAPLRRAPGFLRLVDTNVVVVRFESPEAGAIYAEIQHAAALRDSPTGRHRGAAYPGAVARARVGRDRERARSAARRTQAAAGQARQLRA